MKHAAITSSFEAGPGFGVAGVEPRGEHEPARADKHPMLTKGGRSRARVLMPESFALSLPPDRIDLQTAQGWCARLTQA